MTHHHMHAIWQRPSAERCLELWKLSSLSSAKGLFCKVVYATRGSLQLPFVLHRSRCNVSASGNFADHLISDKVALPDSSSASSFIDQLSDSVLMDCVRLLIGSHLVTGGSRAALGIAQSLGFGVIPKECLKQQQQRHEQLHHEEELKQRKAEELENERKQRRLRVQQRALKQGQPQPTGAAKKQNSLAARLLKQHFSTVPVANSQDIVSTSALPR